MKIQGLNCLIREVPRSTARQAKPPANTNDAKIEAPKTAGGVTKIQDAAKIDALLSDLMMKVEHAAIDPVDKEVIRGMVESDFKNFKSDAEKNKFAQHIRSLIRLKEQKYSCPANT